MRFGFKTDHMLHQYPSKEHQFHRSLMTEARMVSGGLMRCICNILTRTMLKSDVECCCVIFVVSDFKCSLVHFIDFICSIFVVPGIVLIK